MLKLPREEDTKLLAEKLADSARIGDCFALYGQLGAGKTTFARYFIRHLLPEVEDVPSPTFTIVQQYDGIDYNILHIDCYRLDSVSDIENLGIAELFPYSITLIEWPEIIEHMLPEPCTKIYFSMRDGMRIAEIVR